jgi:hypothetical protein
MGFKLIIVKYSMTMVHFLTHMHVTDYLHWKFTKLVLEYCTKFFNKRPAYHLSLHFLVKREVIFIDVSSFALI